MNEAIVWTDPDRVTSRVLSLVLGGAIGAASVRKGHRWEGALNGVFGLWIGSTVAYALSVQSVPVGAGMSLVGSHLVAKVFDHYR